MERILEYLKEQFGITMPSDVLDAMASDFSEPAGACKIEAGALAKPPE
ncbi:MAG: hypothetical protein ACLPWS_15265 [Rhodomicrobium sp.]